MRAIYSALMKRKRTADRFRLPYTKEQTETLLQEACRAEVNARRRTFEPTSDCLRHIDDMANWLTSDDSTFGLFLCGNRGNGKTTLVKALRSLYHFLHADECYGGIDERRYPEYGFEIVPAKDLVLLAKAYNNRTRENTAEVARYKRLRNVEILCIDDLGTEPCESMNYGDYVNSSMDMISYRYEEQLCTMATSNLSAPEISTYYDERFADRFREMMHIIDFGNEPSFRNIKQQ